MEEPTMEEMLELVSFVRDDDDTLFVENVKGTVVGSVRGSVYGSVWGNVGGDVWGSVGGSVGGDVWGSVGGSEWQYVETPKERAIRLIREGKGEEAIKVLEEE